MRTFTISGNKQTPFLSWLAEGIKEEFLSKGYTFYSAPEENIKLVFHFIDPEKPRPYRRQAQATFVVSVMETSEKSENIHKSAYPYLIRSLANHLMYILHNEDGTTDIYFLTPEQGFYKLTYRKGEAETLFKRIYERLEPLAASQLVIDNDFYDDLPEELWNGDEITKSLSESGKKLDRMNLLPAPFPLEEYLTPRDMRHLKKLYGIGGLSYGNLSARRDRESFWMSASGINKANMKTVGEDFLLIKGYDSDKNAIKVSVPPNITPKRASVDAIEHWMIYKEHPEVGAIVHVHAWMDGVRATEINYPCGTIELAKTVAELVRNSEDPSRAIIGLKNHGLTITGTDLDDIFARIEGKIIPQVPMS
ncbi:class II aldolase/adducin family protein [Parageobacillus sp. KH3-4]|uniref:class II aldolase/adducin family protein n=1 Tax=Parageobacillus sp. KH3-4 TaxID=2916802 RepID=UPI001FCC3BD0|nr:class II aldolase/adducin family protein [Parageobacillus sp. KH3-4]BDG47358.1 aldolase [Parageobacillus sp. KH3-4]